MRSKPLVRPFLVCPHQPRVSCHISGKDSGKTAFDGLLHGLPGSGNHSMKRNRQAEE